MQNKESSAWESLLEIKKLDPSQAKFVKNSNDLHSTFKNHSSKFKDNI